MNEKERGKKVELPIYIVAILIFLSSVGFLVFAVYYMVYLPVPMVMQPLRIRILTAVQVDEVMRYTEEERGDVDGYLEDDVEIIEEGLIEGDL